MTSRSRSWWRLIAVLAVVGLVAAGCGDDDGGSAEEEGEEVESRGTVKIGLLHTSVSTQSRQPQVEESRKVAESWEGLINDAGGINGYEVDIVAKDVQADSAKVIQAVKELDQEGVVAIVQSVAQILTPAVATITEANLPVVGGVPYTPEYDTNPLFFQTSAGYYTGVYGQVSAAAHAGADHFLNGWCTEVAGCKQSVQVTKEAAENLDLDFSDIGASAVAADYSSVCLTARQNGVTFFQSNGLNMANLIRDCSRQNYHPIYGVGGAANQATVEVIGSEKYAGNLFEFGAFYDGPEVQRFRQAVERGTDLEDGQWGQTAVQTWLGLEMVGAVLDRMDVDNPTREDFLEAILTVEDEDLDGQIAPVDYTVQKNGDHFIQDCWTEHTIVDGELVHIDEDGEAVDRLTFHCGTGKF